MLDKVEPIILRFEEVKQQLSDPTITSNVETFTQLSKEYKELSQIHEVYVAYQLALSNIEDNKRIIKEETDEEFREMAKADLGEQEKSLEDLQKQLETLLIPKDPEDEKNVLLEIRAGTGGDEASIFAGDLLKMYSQYAGSLGWKTEIVSAHEGSSGGFKEIVMRIDGENVFGILKFESGVHRVQRVPKTESQGRVHTSAASVAVLPEVDEVMVSINPADLKVDTFRASGAGGQHVNKTESAIRITHVPTGVVVECQEGRSQHRNREIAMQWLRSRLYESELQKRQAAQAAERKSQVSTGDRSAKIRTYNYPQGRVTDHRIGLTLYALDAIVGGDLGQVVDKLRMAEQAEKLAVMDGR
ncbi:MAG: peptide chain release factor 1 [Chitinophagales bacterium]|nr:peptide chain release factor 1 [Saprospirales bacterium]MEC9221329.1 peptide chain release factor 1 [Bacteroidota bacterium]